MAADSVLSRIFIYTIILMYIHVSAVDMIKKSTEILPAVRVDLDACYSVRYYSHFLGEINCSSDCTVYNSHSHGLIRYSAELGWHFVEKPFVCMCSCNFNALELRNGNVIGNGLVSHESYLSYTCDPGFKKTTSSRILCLDGFLVSGDDIELTELQKETSAIFRKNPLSNKDFIKLRNSVFKFVIDSDGWMVKDYRAQKGFVFQAYNSKLSYKLVSKHNGTCYKDGYIDVSNHGEIGCTKEITYSPSPSIYLLPSFGFLGIIFCTVGIVLFCLAKRKVSKAALQVQSSRERDLISLIQQETAPLSSGVSCFKTVSNKSRSEYSSHLTGSMELYLPESKHLFFSKSGNSRMAFQQTPEIFRKKLPSDDFFWTIHLNYLEDDCVGDVSAEQLPPDSEGPQSLDDCDDVVFVEHLPPDSERLRCLNTKENRDSTSRHILRKSNSEPSVFENDLQSTSLYVKSNSDSRIVHFGSRGPLLKDYSASANTVLKENIARLGTDEIIQESDLSLETINTAVEVCVVVLNEFTKSGDSSKLDDDSKLDEADITVNKEDNDEREIRPLMGDTEEMKHGSSSGSMPKADAAEDSEGELKVENGYTLDSINLESEITQSFLSSRRMDSKSSRQKSHLYNVKQSLIRAFRLKDSRLQTDWF